MPNFTVFCSIEQENVTSFKVHDPQNRIWGLKLTCTACKEETPNFITFDPTEEEELQGGCCNLYLKCKSCKHELSVNFVNPSAKDLEKQVVKPEGSGKEREAPVLTLDCRGCELSAVSAHGKWEAENEDHDKSYIVDWGADDTADGEEEFTEYDSDIGGLVTISKINLTIRRS